MAVQDYEKVFRCQKCGAPTSIFLIKNSDDKVVIKHRCSEHGDDKIVVPFADKELYLDLIHNGIYRCYKCAQPASLYTVEFKGPWAMISCYCPTHGADVKTQKIWSSFFLEMQNPEYIGGTSAQTPVSTPKVQKEEPLPVQEEDEEEKTEEEEKLYCPNCGTELAGDEKFCGTCGMDLTSE